LDLDEEEDGIIPSDTETPTEEGAENDEELSSKKKTTKSSKHRRSAAKPNTNAGKRSSSLVNNLKIPMKGAPQSKPRFEKRRAALIRSGATDLYQTCMTNHFKVLDDIGLLSKTNAMLTNRLKEMSNKFREARDQFTFINSNRDVDSLSLLKRMMNQAVSQSWKEKKGHRYKDNVLLDFSLNLWILGGPQTYEILYDNMPGVFPGPTVIQSKLEKYNASSMPGKLLIPILHSYSLFKQFI